MPLCLRRAIHSCGETEPVNPTAQHSTASRQSECHPSSFTINRTSLTHVASAMPCSAFLRLGASRGLINDITFLVALKQKPKIRTFRSIHPHAIPLRVQCRVCGASTFPSLLPSSALWQTVRRAPGISNFIPTEKPRGNCQSLGCLTTARRHR